MKEMAAFIAEQTLTDISSNATGRSFTQCTARFKGQRDPVIVQEFLTAISNYKDIKQISNDNALRGLPLLLEDYAAMWWSGVKNTVSTFKQAKSLIWATFASPVADWRIFVTFFENKQQREEPIESFISKKRLLLSQLKVRPCEVIQLNILYGMLNINIRERVHRESFNNFEQFISVCREAESFSLNSQPLMKSRTEERKEVPRSNRCSYCRYKGHSIETCKKRLKDVEIQNDQQATQNPNSSANHPKQPQQQDVISKPTIFCYGCCASNCATCNGNVEGSPQYLETCKKRPKNVETQIDQQATQNPNSSANHPKQPQQQDVICKPIFFCYGCCAPGLYRSICATCNGNVEGSPQYLAFNSTSSTDVGHSLPTAHVEFFGIKGEAVFDSGAKTSVASTELQKILTANNSIFQDFRAEVTLADGSISTGKVMSTICDIIIANRIRRIKLICLPNATKNRTLLGTDFLEQAGIVLNMAQKYWYFEDEHKKKYTFQNFSERNICSMSITKEIFPCIRVDERASFIMFRENGNQMSQQQSTDQFVSGSDYSPHYSQTVFRSGMTVEEQMHQHISVDAPPSKVRKIQQDTDDCNTLLFSMDLKILKSVDSELCGYAAGAVEFPKEK